MNRQVSRGSAGDFFFWFLVYFKWISISSFYIYTEWMGLMESKRQGKRKSIREMLKDKGKEQRVTVQR